LGRSIGHIGVGVRDIEKTARALSEVLGVPMPDIKDLPERQAKVAVVDLGPISMELIQDDSEDGLLATFVREKGEGIHHFCMDTDDIEGDVAGLKARGVEMIHQEPRTGLRGKRIAFISPNSLAGLFCELSEP
jgi:methylmalonyl-CoA epimerase